MGPASTFLDQDIGGIENSYWNTGGGINIDFQHSIFWSHFEIGARGNIKKKRKKCVVQIFQFSWFLP